MKYKVKEGEITERISNNRCVDKVANTNRNLTSIANKANLLSLNAFIRNVIMSLMSNEVSNANQIATKKDNCFTALFNTKTNVDTVDVAYDEITDMLNYVLV